jgi:hypothetical protein
MSILHQTKFSRDGVKPPEGSVVLDRQQPSHAPVVQCLDEGWAIVVAHQHFMNSLQQLLPHLILLTAPTMQRGKCLSP